MQTKFQSIQWPVFQLLSTQNKHIIAYSDKHHSKFSTLLILEKRIQKEFSKIVQ